MHVAMLADDADPSGATVATPEDATRTDAVIGMIETSALTRTWVEAA
jgi:hypothetical protein